MNFNRCFMKPFSLMIFSLIALPFAIEASENTIENERVLFDFQKSGNLTGVL